MGEGNLLDEDALDHLGFVHMIAVLLIGQLRVERTVRLSAERLLGNERNQTAGLAATAIGQLDARQTVDLAGNLQTDRQRLR